MNKLLLTSIHLSCLLCFFATSLCKLFHSFRFLAQCAGQLVHPGGVSSIIRMSELASLTRPLTNTISSPNLSSLRQSPHLQSFISHSSSTSPDHPLSGSFSLHRPPSASISLHQPPSVVILSLLGAILPNRNDHISQI